MLILARQLIPVSEKEAAAWIMEARALVKVAVNPNFRYVREH